MRAAPRLKSQMRVRSWSLRMSTQIVMMKRLKRRMRARDARTHSTRLTTKTTRLFSFHLRLFWVVCCARRPPRRQSILSSSTTMQRL